MYKKKIEMCLATALARTVSLIHKMSQSKAWPEGLSAEELFKASSSILYNAGNVINFSAELSVDKINVGRRESSFVADLDMLLLGVLSDVITLYKTGYYDNDYERLTTTAFNACKDTAVAIMGGNAMEELLNKRNNNIAVSNNGKVFSARALLNSKMTEAAVTYLQIKSCEGAKSKNLLDNLGNMRSNSSSINSVTISVVNDVLVKLCIELENRFFDLTKLEKYEKYILDYGGAASIVIAMDSLAEVLLEGSYDSIVADYARSVVLGSSNLITKMFIEGMCSATINSVRDIAYKRLMHMLEKAHIDKAEYEGILENIRLFYSNENAKSSKSANTNACRKIINLASHTIKDSSVPALGSKLSSFFSGKSQILKPLTTQDVYESVLAKKDLIDIMEPEDTADILSDIIVSALGSVPDFPNAPEACSSCSNDRSSIDDEIEIVNESEEKIEKQAGFKINKDLIN